MSYLNLQDNYFEHKKTRRLVARLGKGSELLPLMLWCHAAKYAPIDGILRDYTPEEIKEFCKWDGDAKSMLQALLDLEFVMLVENGCYKIWEWEDHQGHIVTFSERAKLAAKARWDKHSAKRGKGQSGWNDATSNAKSQTSNAKGNAPNLTIPNLTIPIKHKSVFTPPALEQVVEYCKTKAPTVDPEYYHSKHEANGWLMADNKPVKNWKAHILTWERINRNKGVNSNQQLFSKLPERL